MTEFARIRASLGLDLEGMAKLLGFKGTLRTRRLDNGHVPVTGKIVRKLRARGVDVSVLAREANRLDNERAWLGVFGDYRATPDARFVLSFIRRIVAKGDAQPELWRAMRVALDSEINPPEGSP